MLLDKRNQTIDRKIGKERQGQGRMENKNKEVKENGGYTDMRKVERNGI